MHNTLTEIGLKHNTDKAHFHNYTDTYDEHLTHLRYQQINLLEVGIDRGSSLHMWTEYFANGIIYGVDIYDKSFLNTDKIYTCIGNQENFNEIKNIFSDKKFHVIIDDGGHTVKQQMITLVALFDRLLPGGIYILEDLHTNLLDYSPTEPTALKLLTLMENKKEIPSSFCIHGITENQIQDIYKQVSSVKVFYLKPNEPESITSIIYKK